MFYITYTTAPATNQISLEDLMQGVRPTFTPAQQRTLKVAHLSRDYETRTMNKAMMVQRILEPILTAYADQDMSQFYHSFDIPKASGGTRTINAPDIQLKVALRTICATLDRYCTPAHACAYAYVPGKNHVKALAQHQKQNNEYFLKTDITDFFGSCDPEFISTQLEQIPLFYILKTYHNETFNQLIHIACLDDKLPQGSPLSPWLTNQIMIPIDHAIKQHCIKHSITYTRYADDMLFSAKKSMLPSTPRKLKEILHDTPLCLNESKTRQGTRSGQNWNLGLMLNKDNQITIGHKKKEIFKAQLADLCRNHENWEKTQIEQFQGILAYYMSVEPTFFRNLLTKYQEKFRVNIKDIFQQ